MECVATDPATIQNHRSWLTKITSNKGLDHLKQAYKKREVYTGPWLPDAIPDSLHIWEGLSVATSPEKELLAADSLTTSFLLLIEKLTPEERVVYLLGEIFEYSYKEISTFLGKSEATCRKIAERARKAVQAGKPKFETRASNAEKLITEFFELAKRGDNAAMIQMLAENSEFWSDGGGKVAAAPEVLSDAAKIAQFFKGIGLAFFRKSEFFKTEFAMVNHRPGMIISKKLESGLWVFETIMSFETKDGRIGRIYAQRNPDKLSSLSRGRPWSFRE